MVIYGFKNKYKQILRFKLDIQFTKSRASSDLFHETQFFFVALL